MYCPEIEAQSALSRRCPALTDVKILSDGPVLREDMPPLAGHRKGDAEMRPSKKTKQKKAHAAGEEGELKICVPFLSLEQVSLCATRTSVAAAEALR